MARHLKRKRRTAAEVEAVRDAAREELAAHHPMTLRQLHYRIAHPRTVPNTREQRALVLAEEHFEEIALSHLRGLYTVPSLH